MKIVKSIPAVHRSEIEQELSQTMHLGVLAWT